MIDNYWYDHGGEGEFAKFLFDNIERFKIDVYARDDCGRTPVDLLAKQYLGLDLLEKLEMWLIKYPELFNLDVFKKLSRPRLVNLTCDIYFKCDKHFVRYLNATLRVPEEERKSRGDLWYWFRFSDTEKETLEQVTWKYFKDQIGNPAKKKRI